MSDEALYRASPTDYAASLREHAVFSVDIGMLNVAAACVAIASAIEGAVLDHSTAFGREPEEPAAAYLRHRLAQSKAHYRAEQVGRSLSQDERDAVMLQHAELMLEWHKAGCP